MFYLKTVLAIVLALFCSFIHTSDNIVNFVPVDDSLHHLSRNILQNNDDGASASAANYTFMNVSGCLYFYATQINLTHITKDAPPAVYQLAFDSFDNTKSSCESLVMTSNNPDMPAVLTFNFANTSAGYWFTNLTVGGIMGANTTVLEMDMSRVYAPDGFSYACTMPDDFEIVGAKSKATEKWKLQILKLQVQPNIKNMAFGFPNDCVGFFTIPILTGWLVGLFLLAILTFGVMMVSNITTMDRFDDPKSKPLVHAVAE